MAYVDIINQATELVNQKDLAEAISILQKHLLSINPSRGQSDLETFQAALEGYASHLEAADNNLPDNPKEARMEITRALTCLGNVKALLKSQFSKDMGL